MWVSQRNTSDFSATPTEIKRKWYVRFSLVEPHFDNAKLRNYPTLNFLITIFNILSFMFVYLQMKTWVAVAAFLLSTRHYTSQFVPLPPIFMDSPFSWLNMMLPQYMTTTEGVPLAVPIPVPMPVQIAVPPITVPKFCRNRPCPSCPPCLCAPSCTPAFFSYCSPCHQKCRCRSMDYVPEPLPLSPPHLMPGPVFALPAPLPAFPPSPSFNNPYEWYRNSL
jgi:hypothetical protein